MEVIRLNKKIGNIEIVFMLFLFMIMMILSFIIYMLYTQIMTYVLPPKQDLFYIVQNAYLSLNKNELEYNYYEIDENTLRQKVEQILSLNYTYCKLDNIIYYKDQNKVFVEITVFIEPIILKDYLGNFKLKIKDIIKLKMMEVE